MRKLLLCCLLPAFFITCAKKETPKPEVKIVYKQAPCPPETPKPVETPKFKAKTALSVTSAAPIGRRPGDRKPATNLLYPYMPLTGWVPDPSLTYTVITTAAPGAPPITSHGIHVWVWNNDKFCDAQTLIVSSKEQPLNIAYKRGDVVQIEDWDGYTFEVHSYDASKTLKAKWVQGSMFFGLPGYRATIHGLPVVPLSCQ